MIKSFEFQDPPKSPLYWTANVFKEPRRFEFEPGLNIVIGPNGSGKSTLLKTMAMLTWCHQGGIPKATSMTAFDLGRVKDLALDIVTDGSPTYYIDQEEIPGYMGCGAAFDNEFFDAETLFIKKQSVGQRTMNLVTRLAPYLTGEKIPDPLDFSRYKHWDGWETWQRFIEDRTGGPYRPTLILDEADRALQIDTQITFWKWLKKLSATMQVIVSSHNILSVFHTEANFIEMVPRYLMRCQVGIAEFLGDSNLVFR